MRTGKKPSDWTAEEMRRFAPEFTGEFAELLNAEKGIGTREIPGGTGPASVAQALERAKQALGQLIL